MILDADDVIKNRFSPLRLIKSGVEKTQGGFTKLWKYSNWIYIKNKPNQGSEAKIQRLNVNVPNVHLRFPKNDKKEGEKLGYKLEFTNWENIKASVNYEFLVKKSEPALEYKLKKSKNQKKIVLDTRKGLEINISKFLEIESGSVFEYQIGGDAAKNFDLSQSV